ncbi:MAG: SCO family protein [Acidobacteria bacterium]|nr:MAG: SCO family protein [Acidobacteriota bacterium]
MSRAFFAALVLAGLLAQTARAQAPSGLPPALRQVGIDQKLDARLPLDVAFADERGAEVRLGDYFGRRPAVLALVYYDCPMLCTLVLNGLVKSLRALKLDAGADFEVVVCSIDPGERPPLAARKREMYVRTYARPASAAGWHFLTGNAESIARLADAVGFRYTYDPATRQFAHASGIMVATPDGRLARYLYGIEYSARDLRLALVEASAGKIGTRADQVLLYCFHYDPKTGKYGVVIMNVIRLLGSATALALAGLVVALMRRERSG